MMISILKGLECDLIYIHLFFTIIDFSPIIGINKIELSKFFNFALIIS